MAGNADGAAFGTWGGVGQSAGTTATIMTPNPSTMGLRATLGDSGPWKTSGAITKNIYPYWMQAKIATKAVERVSLQRT